MVVGERFIWAHLGKTGGDSTHRMFVLINRGDLRIDKTTDRRKHNNFVQGARRFNVSLEGRQRIMNIRRLPFWLLSHNQHMGRKDSIEFSSDDLAKGVVRRKNGDTTADQVLESFESDKVDHWLRTEYLSRDFLRVMARFTSIPPRRREKIRSTWANKASYEKRLGAWYDNAMLKALYDNNPRWRDLESRLYGGLARICEVCGALCFDIGGDGAVEASEPCCRDCAADNF